MHTIRLTVPLPVPSWLHRRLQKIKRAVTAGRTRGPDLVGDREVEYSFIAAHLPEGPGRALDFGCGPACLSLMAAERGFQVIALDQEAQSFPWRHQRVIFHQADLLQANFEEHGFDLIINCSAVEHVGLPGRYGVRDGDPDGDLRAMAKLRSMLRPAGTMLLTIPCGRDTVVAPLHRVYGRERLPRLLAGYRVEKEGYWVKDQMNCWVSCAKHIAIDVHAKANFANPLVCSYALGCFVLRCL